jgi:hypothetical protein
MKVVSTIPPMILMALVVHQRGPLVVLVIFILWEIFFHVQSLMTDEKKPQ